MRRARLSLWMVCVLSHLNAAFSSELLSENGQLDGATAGMPVPAVETGNEDGLHVGIKYNMQKSLEVEEEGCLIQPGRKECLQECGFNATAKTFLVIHGWTMSGMYESWMQKLLKALQVREQEANIVVVDWLPFAHQLYPDAVNHTRQVGRSIADLLDWLQEEAQLPLDQVHMIGYSLGAHVAGYAGSFVQGTVGRITGLDPAGPMFEGVESNQRLSPDDADFVDVLHTYTREALGLSIGIQMPVGDIDIYPNGGDVQPGCRWGDVLSAAAIGFLDVVKCEHERAVHLFVDSLLNKDHVSFAYQCTGPDRFKKGICLSCRKNRCNNMGYNAKKMRKRRNSKMYLKTRADTPFGGYHYQMKMHVFSRNQSDNADPTFFVKLYGSNKDTGDMTVDVSDTVGLNLTNTFLIFTEEDIGELLKIKLSWEATGQSWNSVWKTMWSWSDPSKKLTLEVRRIRVKCGETQKKFTFCAEDPFATLISPGKDITFVKCRDGWEVKPKKRLHF